MPTALLFVGLAAELYALVHDLPIMNWGVNPRNKSSRAPGSGGAPIGELVSRHNQVRVQDAGDLSWDDTRVSQTLYKKQKLLTLDDSRAEIALLDGTGLVIGEKSLVVLESEADAGAGMKRIVVRLMRGQLHKGAPRKTSDLLRRLGGSTPELEIRAGDTRVGISPSTELSLEVMPNEPSGARLSVLAGEARLETPGGSVQVKSGEEARSSGNRETPPEAHKMPFSLLSPRAAQGFEPTEDTHTVRFRWNSSAEAVNGRPQRLEASRDPSFETGVVSSGVAAASPPLEHVELNVKVPVGNKPEQWFWRVRALTSSRPSPMDSLSGIETFWINPKQLPKPRYPNDLAHSPAGKPVELAWTAIEGASGYEIEAKGGANTQSWTSAETFTRMEGPPPGEISWRIRARLLSGGVGGWSLARKLTVDPIAPAESVAPTQRVESMAPAPVGTGQGLAKPAPARAPAALQAPLPPPDSLDEPEIRRDDPSMPEPHEPQPRHSLHWLERALRFAWQSASPSNATAAEPMPAPAAKEDTEVGSWNVKLKWKAVKGAKSYRIQVGREKNFSTVISQGESQSTEWTWTYLRGMENSKGRAFFRVASVDEHGLAGTFSKAKPIKFPREALLAKYANDVVSKPEVYSATEAGEDAHAAPIPADAAAAGNLHTLGSGPKASALKTPALATDLPLTHPTTPKPVATPPRASDTSFLEIARAAEEQREREIHLTLALQGGLGNLSQSSGASTLSTVRPKSPYPQQKLSIRTEIMDWTGQFEATFATFGGAETSRPILQTSFHASQLRLELLHSAIFARSNAWKFQAGGEIDRSFRWIKTGPQTVDSQGALSLGPSARAMRTYSSERRFSLHEIGAGLALPLSGAISGGQAGVQGRLWAEWNIIALGNQWFGVKTEAEVAYLRWSNPDSTSTTGWTAWLAPALRF